MNPWPQAGDKCRRLRASDAWRLHIVFVTHHRWRARGRLKVSAGKQFVLVTFASVTRKAASHSSCFVLTWQRRLQIFCFRATADRLQLGDSFVHWVLMHTGVNGVQGHRANYERPSGGMNAWCFCSRCRVIGVRWLLNAAQMIFTNIL